jgi:two-component system chemotaxis response regulator CheB
VLVVGVDSFLHTHPDMSVGSRGQRRLVVPIVAIGASAGGIEPLLQVVSGLPPSIRAAVVVVVHFPAHRRSALPSVLARAGQLPASHPEDGDPLAAGQIYVAPPDHHLLVQDGVVRVVRGPRENGSRPAIDPLFRSAAISHGSAVIGVVLSGELDDGSAGLAEVAARGGYALVQDPREATSPSMPRAAATAAGVDVCLPADQLAGAISELVTRIVNEERGPTRSPKRATSAVATDREDREDRVARREIQDAAFSQRPDSPLPPGARPVLLGCPDCGGALWQLGEDDVLRYRCRVGHGFTALSLLAGQLSTAEEALWYAYRALDERAVLADRLARRATTSGHDRSVARFEAERDRAREQAEAIRTLLLQEPTRDEGAYDGVEPPGDDEHEKAS